LTVGEFEAQGIAGTAVATAAIQPRHLQGDGELGAEFLRLIEGASGQRLAGDAGRETEIVFDPGGRPRLSAEGALVEYEH
jgi:hypothetical protein